MKVRIFTSMIITGILASSAVQAAPAITVEDINASFVNPSFTRNVDVSGYYTAPKQLQQTAQKSTCETRMVFGDDNSVVTALYPNEPTIGNYITQSTILYMCL